MASGKDFPSACPLFGLLGDATWASYATGLKPAAHRAYADTSCELLVPIGLTDGFALIAYPSTVSHNILTVFEGFSRFPHGLQYTVFTVGTREFKQEKGGYPWQH